VETTNQKTALPRARLTPAQRIAAAESALARLKSAATKQDRRDATREKIVIGAALLKLADGQPRAGRAELVRELWPLLVDRDRAFLVERGWPSPSAEG
jgi:hypothetical protein